MYGRSCNIIRPCHYRHDRRCRRRSGITRTSFQWALTTYIHTAVRRFFSAAAAAAAALRVRDNATTPKGGFGRGNTGRLTVGRHCCVLSTLYGPGPPEGKAGETESASQKDPFSALAPTFKPTSSVL